MYRLRLSDGIDTIDFINDPGDTYFLEDDSFDFSDPDYKSSDSAYITEWGDAFDSRRYGPRTVSFSVIVKGANMSSVADSVDRLVRMSDRAMSMRQLSGGSHNSNYSYNPSGNSVIYGQQGLQLIIQYGSNSPTNVVGEFGQTYSDTRDVYYYVAEMTVSEINPLSTEQNVSFRGVNALFGVKVNLVVSPFGYGGPIRISVPSAGDGRGFSFLPFPATDESFNYGARMFIPASSVPGSGEALTQFTMNVHNLPGGAGGDGVIIARDAGRSLINCPSAFVDSSTKLGRGLSKAIIPVGYRTASGTNYYDVQVQSLNPAQVRYRTNGGAWSSSITPSPFQVITINPEFEFYLQASDLTPYDSNGSGVIMRSYSTSYFLSPAPSQTISSLLPAIAEEDGYVIQHGYLVIPSGVHGRYRVLFSVSAQQAMEYKMNVSFEGPNYSVYSYSTNWRSMPGYFGTLDMGVIDCSPSSMPTLSVPGGSTVLFLTFSARLNSEFTSGVIQVYGVAFVPFSDERSYMNVKWYVISNYPGFQIISNFDPRNPLVGMVARDYRTGFNGSNINAVVTELRQTRDGSPITLLPGVDNTLLMIPTFSVSHDYRTALLTSLGTGDTTLSIRPAYFAAR